MQTRSDMSCLEGAPSRLAWTMVLIDQPEGINEKLLKSIEVFGVGIEMKLYIAAYAYPCL